MADVAGLRDGVGGGEEERLGKAAADGEEAVCRESAEALAIQVRRAAVGGRDTGRAVVRDPKAIHGVGTRHWRRGRRAHGLDATRGTCGVRACAWRVCGDTRHARVRYVRA